MTKQPMFTEYQLESGLNYALYYLSCGDNSDIAAKNAAQGVSNVDTERFHFEQWVKCQPRFTAVVRQHQSTNRKYDMDYDTLKKISAALVMGYEAEYQNRRRESVMAQMEYAISTVDAALLKIPDAVDVVVDNLDHLL
jgi:hypothetical protein